MKYFNNIKVNYFWPRRRPCRAPQCRGCAGHIPPPGGSAGRSRDILCNVNMEQADFLTSLLTLLRLPCRSRRHCPARSRWSSCSICLEDSPAPTCRGQSRRSSSPSPCRGRRSSTSCGKYFKTEGNLGSNVEPRVGLHTLEDGQQHQARQSLRQHPLLGLYSSESITPHSYCLVENQTYSTEKYSITWVTTSTSVILQSSPITGLRRVKTLCVVVTVCLTSQSEVWGVTLNMLTLAAQTMTPSHLHSYLSSTTILRQIVQLHYQYQCGLTSL